MHVLKIVQKERRGLPVWKQEQRQILKNGLVTSIRNMEIYNLEITAIVILAIFTSIGGPNHRGDCKRRLERSIKRWYYVISRDSFTRQGANPVSFPSWSRPQTFLKLFLFSTVS